jgi:hypothetical protein
MNWNKEEIKLLKTLSNPDRIQVFLDSLDYNPNYECRSPRWVMRKHSAHCFEGALFAAAALQFIGYKPLIVDMRAVNATGVLLPNPTSPHYVSGNQSTGL